jgi:predicted dehydrogenase
MDALMLRDFINHLKQDKQPMLSGIDGRKALEVVIAAYESVSTGKVINLN